MKNRKCNRIKNYRKHNAYTYYFKLQIASYLSYSQNYWGAVVRLTNFDPPPKSGPFDFEVNYIMYNDKFDISYNI